MITDDQKRQQITFLKRFVNHWGLSVEEHPNILLINYDEKWLYGLVPRTMAKMCPQMGLFRNSKLIYHKNFINKVLLVAVTGYAFKGNIEDGGEGVHSLSHSIVIFFLNFFIRLTTLLSFFDRRCLLPFVRCDVVHLCQRLGAETGVIVIFAADFGEFVVRVCRIWLCVERSSGDRGDGKAIVSCRING